MNELLANLAKLQTLIAEIKRLQKHQIDLYEEYLKLPLL